MKPLDFLTGLFQRNLRKRQDEIVEAVRARRLTYLENDRMGSLLDCLSSLNKSVPGDIAEFGVALGGSGIILASLATPERSYYGFDVFGMIPPPSDADGADVHQRFEKIAAGQSVGIGGDTYYGYVDDLLDQVKDNFKAFGLDPDGKHISFVVGDFAQTLPKVGNLSLALAHVDCDWYAPVKACLEFAWPCLSPGGFIVVDDYVDWDGCRKATDEFLASRSDVAVLRLEPHAVLHKPRQPGDRTHPRPRE